jgi:hypothetical protein
MSLVEARIIQLRPGESCAVSDNEAIVIIPRSSTVFDQTDEVFWETEPEAKQTAFLNRELNSKTTRWAHENLTIDKTEFGYIVYYQRADLKLYLHPRSVFSIEPFYFVSALEAYANAKVYTDRWGVVGES